MIFMSLSASRRVLETQQALIIAEAMTLGPYVGLTIIFHSHLYFSEISRAKKTLTLTEEVTSVPSLQMSRHRWYSYSVFCGRLALPGGDTQTCPLPQKARLATRIRATQAPSVSCLSWLSKWKGWFTPTHFSCLKGHWMVPLFCILCRTELFRPDDLANTSSSVTVCSVLFLKSR